MPLTICCPSCSTRLQVPDNAAGRNVKCPKCGTVMSVPGKAAARPAPSAIRPARAAPPPADDVEEPPAPPRRRREEDDDAPAPKKKSKTGLLIGLIAGGVGLLAVCCCGVGVGGYFVWPMLSNSNPKVTKENYGLLHDGMTMAEVETVLGSGRVATPDDVRSAFQANFPNKETAVGQWTAAISRGGGVYCWRNGPKTILLSFDNSPRQGGKVRALLYTEVSGNHFESQQRNIP
jgi:predicted Zn finger-like uncharacterized protein